MAIGQVRAPVDPVAPHRGVRRPGGVGHDRLCGMPRHSYLCAPRWADVDQFGHVNNTRFLAYLEQARVDLFFHHAAQVGVSTLARGAVVARHEIDYLRPVRYQHRPLRVELWCGRIAGASFTVDYEIVDGDGDGAASGQGTEWVAARARSLLVAYDLAAERPRRLTTAECEFLGRYQVDPAE